MTARVVPFPDTRVAGALGLAGVAAGALGPACAAACYPGFSLWYDSLSMLGTAAGGLWFNGGLLACGVLEMFLAAGILAHLSEGKPLRRAGAVLLMLSMAFLSAVGIVTEDYGLAHFYTAAGFFTLFAAASLALGLSFFRDPPFRTVGALALFAAVMGVIAWFLPGEGWAIPELAAALPGMLWVGALAWTLASKQAGNR